MPPFCSSRSTDKTISISLLLRQRPLLLIHDESFHSETSRAVDLVLPWASRNSSGERGQALQSDVRALPRERGAKTKGNHDPRND